MRAWFLVLALVLGCLLAVAVAWALRLTGMSGGPLAGLSWSMIGAGLILVAAGLRLAFPVRARRPAVAAAG